MGQYVVCFVAALCQIFHPVFKIRLVRHKIAETVVVRVVPSAEKKYFAIVNDGGFASLDIKQLVFYYLSRLCAVKNRGRIAANDIHIVVVSVDKHRLKGKF